jgi:hypothetical protein
VAEKVYVCDLRIAARISNIVLCVAKADIEFITEGVAATMAGPYSEGTLLWYRNNG